ncbi:DUF4867 family protein [Loigolactobacillus coryniformis]|uniref:DUF4867 family protein n=1 Tax=Loigolactobacillus coryniformis TaxID=1610 RepID=UPI00345C74B1
MFETIQKMNSTLPLFHVTNPAFQQYGEIIKTLDPTDLLATLATKETPLVGNHYVTSDAALEKSSLKGALEQKIFAGLPIEMGYCNGHSYQLNCLEWHHSPEVNVATEDIILFLGQTRQLKNAYYNVRDLKAFYIPAGTMIMIYGTTLHFVPCQTTRRGFKCLVALLQGVNTDLPHRQRPIDTLFKRSKWLITHPDNQKFVAQGAFPGIIGENYAVKSAS